MMSKERPQSRFFAPCYLSKEATEQYAEFARRADDLADLIECGHGDDAALAIECLRTMMNRVYLLYGDRNMDADKLAARLAEQNARNNP